MSSPSHDWSQPTASCPTQSHCISMTRYIYYFYYHGSWRGPIVRQEEPPVVESLSCNKETRRKKDVRGPARKRRHFRPYIHHYWPIFNQNGRTSNALIFLLLYCFSSFVVGWFGPKENALTKCLVIRCLELHVLFMHTCTASPKLRPCGENPVLLPTNFPSFKIVQSVLSNICSAQWRNFPPIKSYGTSSGHIQNLHSYMTFDMDWAVGHTWRLPMT